MLSTRHLGTSKAPWVVLSFCDADALRSTVTQQLPRLSVVSIPGKLCRTKSSLFRAFAEALRFPDYFGKNWDALEECITDLSWLEASGYLLIVSDAEMLLEKVDSDYKTFVSIMNDAGKSWAERSSRPTPFHVVLTTSSALSDRRQRQLQPIETALTAT